MQTPPPLDALKVHLRTGEQLLMIGQAHYPLRKKFFGFAIISCFLPVLSAIILYLFPNLATPVCMVMLFIGPFFLVPPFVLLGWLDNIRVKEEKELFYALTDTRLFKLLGGTVTEIASRSQISKMESNSGLLTLRVASQEAIIVRVLQGLPKLQG